MKEVRQAFFRIRVVRQDNNNEKNSKVGFFLPFSFSEFSHLRQGEK